MQQQLVSTAQDCASNIATLLSSLATIPPLSAQRLRTPLLLLTKQAMSSKAKLAPSTLKRLRCSSAVQAKLLLTLDYYNVSQLSRLVTTPQLTAPAILSQLIITSITNYNCCAKCKYIKTQEHTRVKVQRVAGLVALLLQVLGRKRKAYTSIKLGDAAYILQLFKQVVKGNNAKGTAVNLFNSVATLYIIAMPILNKARLISNVLVQDSAAVFLCQQRIYRTPFKQNIAKATYYLLILSCNAALLQYLAAASALTTLLISTTSVLTAAQTLYNYFKQKLDIIHIKYCQAIVFLSKVYIDKVQEISS